jgi:hypothetical protein
MVNAACYHPTLHLYLTIVRFNSVAKRLISMVESNFSLVLYFPHDKILHHVLLCPSES